MRCANYIITLRKELLRLAHACGVSHPSLVGIERLELLDADGSAVSAATRFGYQPGWGLPSPEEATAVAAMVTAAGAVAVALPGH